MQAIGAVSVTGGGAIGTNSDNQSGTASAYSGDVTVAASGIYVSNATLGSASTAANNSGLGGPLGFPGNVTLSVPGGALTVTNAGSVNAGAVLNVTAGSVSLSGNGTNLTALVPSYGISPGQLTIASTGLVSISQGSEVNSSRISVSTGR